MIENESKYTITCKPGILAKKIQGVTGSEPKQIFVFDIYLRFDEYGKGSSLRIRTKKGTKKATLKIPVNGVLEREEYEDMEEIARKLGKKDVNEPLDLCNYYEPVFMVYQRKQKITSKGVEFSVDDLLFEQINTQKVCKALVYEAEIIGEQTPEKLNYRESIESILKENQLIGEELFENKYEMGLRLLRIQKG